MNSSEGESDYFDFDNRKVYSHTAWSKWELKSSECTDWISERGVDFGFFTNETSQARELAGFNLGFFMFQEEPVRAELRSAQGAYHGVTNVWNDMAADQMWWQLRGLLTNAEPRIIFGTTNWLNRTMAFYTREGGIGLLQITDFTENPRGVKIRYKLVQPSRSNIETESSLLDSTAAFQFRWVANAGDTNSPADVLIGAGGPTGRQKFRVLLPVVLTEQDVDSAGFSKHQSDEKELEVFLSLQGGEKFAAASAKNTGRQLAIVWHGRVIAAPVIRSAIMGRRVSINGRFSDAEAQQILDMLNHRQPSPPKN